MTELTAAQPENGIAIIGMSGRFPGCPDIEALWRLIVDGGDGGTSFDDDELLQAGVSADLLGSEDYVKAGYPLADPGEFDADFFGYSPAEAELMDPQHRLMLETSWQALERAGNPPRGNAEPIGVFLSSSASAYLEQRVLPIAGTGLGSDELQRALGTDAGMLALRVSYKLNLTGPSLSVQTACSSSLVAVHLAMQSLLTHECDLALAGGVAVRLFDLKGYQYEEGSILSADGRCRPFDADASGTVSGDGVGVVVLKRLEDAVADRDHIDAVILGSAINNDGSAKVGFTAPSSEGQAAVIAEALAVAGVSPDTVQYVELHGTGTPLGDPIEAQALAQVFGGGHRKSPCVLGSVKSNIGHLDVAAGVAGLIKTALSLKYGVIPGTAHFREPNPHLDLDPRLFQVTSGAMAWPQTDGPRRAGLSAFGVGGTNAHLVLQAAPTTTVPCPESTRRDVQVLPLSGRSSSGVAKVASKLARQLSDDPGTARPSLEDVAYTLQERRRDFPSRAAVVCRDVDDAIAAWESISVTDPTDGAADPRVVFMFPGQGSQFAGMGADLYERETAFRAAMDACAEAFRPHLDWDVRDVAFGLDERDLRQTERTQPTVFSIEYSLARLLMSWGIEPEMMIGHSLGEYVAACLAGVFTLPDAAKVVAARGTLMQEVPPGRMISVALSEAELSRIVEGCGSVAAVNGPQLCVLAGTDEDISVAQERLAAQGVPVRPLVTSHAFHTAMMDRVLPDFEKVVAGVELRAPNRPFVSNVTGRRITAEQATSAGYWASHLREPVRFEDGLVHLAATAPGERLVLVEVGPGSALSGMARLASGMGADADGSIVTVMPRDPQPGQEGVEATLRAVAALWQAGVAVDWVAVRGPGPVRVVPLPGHEFERREHLLPRPQNGSAQAAAGALSDPTRWAYTPVWHRCRPVVPDPTATSRTWLVVEDRAGLARRVGQALQRAGHEIISIVPAQSYARVDDVTFRIDPDQPEDCDRVVRELTAAGRIPTRLLHAGSVLTDVPGGPVERYEAIQRLGLLGLVSLVQALNEAGSADGLRIVALTNDLQDVAGTPPTLPERATIHGAMTVLPQEIAGLGCRCVDIELPVGEEAEWAGLTDLLVAELSADTDERYVAYRRGFRWRQSFSPVELPADGTTWDGAGGYLITGSATEAGLMVAEDLAAAGARLVLVGPPEFPPRETWSQALDGTSDGHGDGADEPAQRIGRLSHLLEHRPEQVTFMTADLRDAEQVRAVVESANTRLGRLDGVFHLLDERASGMVAVKSRDDLTAALDARVRSTLLLDDALGADSGFMLVGSSTTGIVGGFGQLENCSVATFLDSFAQSRSAPNRLVTTVDWGQWCWDDWFEQQMADLPAVRADYERLRRMYGIPVREGLDRTKAALGSGLTTVVISTRDFRDVLAEQSTLTASEFTSSLAREGADATTGDWNPADIWPDDEVAQQVAAVWHEMLGVSMSDPDTDFYTVGGNSLFAIQVVARLRQVYGTFPMSAIFEAPTVPELAAAIRLHQAQMLEDDEIESLLHEVEALTPEEIDAWWAGEHG